MAVRKRREEEERQRQREQRKLQQEKERQEAIARGEEPPAEDEVDEEAGEPAAQTEEQDSGNLEDQKEEMDAAQYPFRVPLQDRLNILLIGPPVCGKTTSARGLATTDRRRCLSIDEIMEWVLSSPPSLQDDASKERQSKLVETIAQLEEEHDKTEAERAKKEKGYVPHKLERLPLQPAEIAYWIQRRVDLPDCNCGVIFDGLDTKYLAGVDEAAEAVMGALPESLSVVGIGLDGVLGLTAKQAVLLGVAGLPSAVQDHLANPGGGDAAEVFNAISASLHHHYTTLQGDLATRAASLQAELQGLESQREVLGPPVSPPSATDEGTDDAPALSFEEMQANLERARLDEQIESVKKDLSKCSEATTKLEASCLSKEDDIARRLIRMIAAVEAAAPKLNGLVKERTLRPDADAGNMKFEPPTRQESGITAVSGAPPATSSPLETADDAAHEQPDMQSAVSLMPLGLFGGVDGRGFAALQHALGEAIPKPLVPAEPPLPPPSTMQLLTKPSSRPSRAAVENFSLITIVPAEGTGDAKTAGDTQIPGQARWVIQPHEDCRLLLKFFSDTICSISSSLQFEVVGGVHGNAPAIISASGVTAFPAINGDPRNVFMRRVKAKPASGYASKQYITSLGVYDFGPLLAGRDAASSKPPVAKEGETLQPMDPFVKQHIEHFRITNSALFQAKVSLKLASAPSADAAPADPKKKADPAGASAANFDDFPFIIEPTYLELDVDETKEVKVCCFPTREGTYSDTVVVNVENNPEPVEFPICAIGSVPKVNLETSEVDFGRLLQNQRGTSYIRLSNVCAVPIKWKLQADEGSPIPENFILESSEGVVAVADDRIIAITFHAKESNIYKFSLKLLVGDTEGLKPLEEAKTIEVQGEAFNVDVVPEFSNGSRGLDFGEVRVGSEVEQEFQLVNNGKYAINYDVKVRRKVIRDILDVDLEKGDNDKATLEPGQKKPIKVRLRPMFEVSIPDASRQGRNDEMDIVIFEAETGQQVQLGLPPITLSFRAMFNSFSVTPPRGLNFGPIRLSESGTKEFDIYNDGIFKLDWQIFDTARPLSLQQKAPATEGDKSPTKGKGAKVEEAAAGSCTVGPFSISPAEGALNPKDSAKIKVSFTATENKDYDCKIGIHVDGLREQATSSGPGRTERLESDHAQNMGSTLGPGSAAFREYLLTAQGCTPGIDTENLHAIFEEQFVARSLEDAIATAGRVDIRCFCEDDRVFSFGPVVLHGQGSEAHGNDAAKFRITNPKPIACDVKFEIKPKGLAAAGGKAEPGKDLPFELSTRELHIPPHEYRYVKVRFKPPGLQSYSAFFEATVVEGKDAASNSLKFELRGDGTVPTISLEGPAIFGDKGGELKFGKLRVGQAHMAELMLRNNGIIPATARCDVDASPHFTVACAKSVHLEPKGTQKMTLRFHPQAEGDFTLPLHLYTLHNSFEDATIQLLGTGAVESVAWDLTDSPQRPTKTEDAANAGVMAPLSDALFLGEVALGDESVVTFHISNTSKEPIRFQFPESLPAPYTDCLKIAPSVGHVQPKSRKAITFTFKPSDKIAEQATPVQVSIAGIAYEGPPEDWDDTMLTVDFDETRSPRGDKRSSLAPGSPQRQTSSGSARRMASASPKRSSVQGRTDVITEPEPAHRIIDGSQKEMTLNVSAVADERTLTCSTERIHFASTVMFQTKVHRVNVQNTSKVMLPYSWVLRTASGSKPSAAYTIQPKTGKLAAGETAEFTVRFEPKEVENFRCRLDCDVPHLVGESGPLQIQLDASAVRPWCHFELPPSDYRARRQSDTPLDPKYNIVEIESMGTRVKNTKRFYVLNPTAESYEFQWTPEQKDPYSQSENDPFRCLSRRGTIQSGKKYEMVFEYMPNAVGTHESCWTFSLLKHDVVQSFLLVGSVKEPRVGMDTPNINFNRLLLGGQSTEKFHIVNKEHIPFSFAFERSSFDADGQLPVLSVSPMSGVVGPGASFPVTVTFKPVDEKSYNFNVICNVKRRAQPIALNVKGEGYKIHTKLVLEEKEREDRLLHTGVKELLDFGSMQVQETRSFSLRLSSPTFQRESAPHDDQDMPNVSYNFIWQVRTLRGAYASVPSLTAPPYLSITPVSGAATLEKETLITLEYCPTDAHVLDGTTLRLLLPSGPGELSYNIELRGRARRPNVDFSLSTYDFGPCFVKRSVAGGEPTSPTNGNSPHEKFDLLITNRDASDCWLSTTFTRTAYLDVQLPACMLAAGHSTSVPVIFTPRDHVEYRERIEFVVNDCVKQYVNIRGRGCPINLELASIEMQNVDFGVVVGHQPVSRSVRVVNRSQRAVDFSLSDVDGKLMDKGVSWQPTSQVTLRPKEQMNIDLTFASWHRLAPFKSALRAICNYGQEVQLLNVAGTCHTAEVKLSEHSVLFGEVVYQSKAVRRLRMNNYGDLGVKYRFDLPPKLAALYSVEPAEGFVAAHGEVQLMLCFHPGRSGTSAVDRPEKGDAGRPKRIQCVFEPGHLHEPVELIVQGKGIEQPDSAVKMLKFTSEVRERSVQQVQVPGEPLLKNPTGEPWKLNPVVKTEEPAGVDYWSVPAEVIVPPGGSANMEVTYRPLTMTLRDEDKEAADADDDGGKTPRKNKKRDARPEKHLGKIFLATPDGNAFVYHLEGTATASKAVKRIEAEVQCKMQHMQTVEVSNWLPESQRFNVRIDLVEPADAADIKIQGAEAFDVPPGVAKDYRFSVYAYREGSGLARLTFTNPRTDEFLIVEVALKFVAPESLQTLELSAACRQTAVRPIAVANPLSVPVTFKCECSCPEIRCSPAQIVAAPSSEVSVDIIFRPVLPGSGETMLKLTSTELGNYPYTIKYEGKPAGLEKTIVFKAPLGSLDTMQTFRFLHYAKKPAQYTAAVEAAPGHKGPAGGFIVETKDIKAAAATDEGVEVNVDIRFQPSSLGEMRALLVLSSPDGGDYKALLVGYAQPPQPQGPIVISKGKPGAVDFVNPFDEAVQFNVQVDNPSFVVPNRSFKLDPKKNVSIGVNFQSDKAQGGRLIVTSERISNPWTYFLKGTV
eukprot:TRINITY_DN120685_c0_g1_i1.p1 TRINITY_DN120685_c0_g1~~TRINITY_DN120685_c0_g1_i1.p1  ORF type:complete len:3365 (+),score=726.60 TRINITY_DN120685_c0_g1_i1:1028-10096(+)